LRRTVRQGEGLDKETYRHIAGAAREVLSRFPPDRYFYVGVGRSPSALIEILQAIVPHQAQGFPASGLGGNPKIDSATYAEYRRHFRRFFPRPERLEGRTILLMDSVSRGNTLATMRDLLGRYLSESGVEAHIETLAVRGAGLAVDHRLDRDFDAMAAGSDAIARYRAHYIGRDTLAELEPNPGRVPFLRSLLAHLSLDRTFDRFLERGFREIHELEPRPQHEWLDLGVRARTGAARATTDRAAANRAAAKDALVRTLANGLAGEAFRGSSGGQPPRSLALELRFREDFDEWEVRSKVPERVWRPHLSVLQRELEAFTRPPHAHARRRGLHIELRLDEQGEVVRHGVSVQLTAPRTQVERFAPVGTLDSEHRSRRSPNATAGPEELAEYLAQGLAGVLFQDGSNRPAKSVRFELLPDDVWNRDRFEVRSNVPRGHWEHAFEHTGRALVRLARNERNPDRPFGLRVVAPLDERGQIQEGRVTVERFAPPVALLDRPRRFEIAVPGDERKRLKAHATTEELATYIADGLAGRTFRNSSDRLARSLRIELEPTGRDWRGRQELRVDSKLPSDAIEPLLEGAGSAIERLTRHPKNAHHRYGLRIELRLDANGQVSRNGGSVERFVPAVEVKAQARDVGWLPIEERDPKGPKVTATAEELAAYLEPRFAGVAFETGSGRPARTLTLELHRDEHRKRFRVSSRMPDDGWEHALEHVGRTADRLTYNDRNPQAPYALAIRLTLTERGEVAPGGVAVERVERRVELLDIPQRGVTLRHEPTRSPRNRSGPPRGDRRQRKGALAKALADGFSGVLLRSSDGRPARAVTLRFEPTEQGGVEVRSPLPGDVLEGALTQRVRQLVGELSQSHRRPHPDLRVDVRLDEHGRVQAENVSVTID
jgi:hypothetical protein